MFWLKTSASQMGYLYTHQSNRIASNTQDDHTPKVHLRKQCAYWDIFCKIWKNEVSDCYESWFAWVLWERFWEVQLLDDIFRIYGVCWVTHEIICYQSTLRSWVFTVLWLHFVNEFFEHLNIQLIQCTHFIFEKTFFICSQEKYKVDHIKVNNDAIYQIVLWVIMLPCYSTFIH